jgi:hypothetical protein
VACGFQITLPDQKNAFLHIESHEAASPQASCCKPHMRNDRAMTKSQPPLSLKLAPQGGYSGLPVTGDTAQGPSVVPEHYASHSPRASEIPMGENMPFCFTSAWKCHLQPPEGIIALAATVRKRRNVRSTHQAFQESCRPLSSNQKADLTNAPLQGENRESRHHRC